MTTNNLKTGHQYLWILLLLSVPSLAFSQELENATYYGEDSFILEGTGDDHERTVDGVHFTDLGFIRYA